MLPGSMQEAIKARAARKKEFKDPYVKPKMSKESFLAVQEAEKKSRGGGMSLAAPVGGSGGAPVDLSPLLQGQAQMQRQLQQLAEQMKQLGINGVQVTTTTAAPASTMTSADWTADLDKLKRELRQSQRQATSDVVAQVEDLVRNAFQNTSHTSGSGGETASSDAEVSRLKREIAQLKGQVSDLQDENETLRKKCAAAEQRAAQAEQKAATASASAAATTAPKATTTTSRAPAPAPAPAPPRARSSEMQVTETATAYALALDLPGVKTSDLKISYGSGALELTVKGKTYSFEVEASLIDPSGISAMLQPNGGLQITVPKKK